MRVVIKSTRPHIKCAETQRGRTSFYLIEKNKVGCTRWVVAYSKVQLDEMNQEAGVPIMI